MGRGTIGWRVVIAATAVMTVEGYDLGVYGTLLPLLLADNSLNLGTAEAGLVGSAVFVGMLVGGLAVGALCARFGQRAVMTGGVLLFSLSMVGTVMSQTSPELMVARLAAGCGLGVVMPTCMAAARSACDQTAAPLCLSVVMGGVPAGGAVAALASWSLSTATGWRPLFGLGALLGASLLPLPASVLAGGDSGAPAGRARLSPRQVPVTRLVAPAAAGAVATFCFLLSFYGLMTWVTELMTELRVPLGGALQMTLVLNLGAVAGSCLTGLAATRFGPFSLIAVSGLAAAACLVLLPSGGVGGPALMVVIVLLGMASPSTQNLVNALVADAVSQRWRVGVLGVTLGIGRLGAVAAPLLGSWLLLTVTPGEGLAAPAGAVFMSFAVASVCGVAAAWWLRRMEGAPERLGN